MRQDLLRVGRTRSSLLIAIGLTLGPLVYAAFLDPLVAFSLFSKTRISAAWVWLIGAVLLLEGWAWCVLAHPVTVESTPPADADSEAPPAAPRAKASDDSLSVVLVFLLFFRTAVEVLMLFGALEAAGYNARDSLGAVGCFFVVIKFLVCLFALMTEASAPPRRRWVIAQVVALVWCCLAYTMTWGRMLSTGRTFVGRPLGEAIVESFAAGLLFLLLYGPIRIHAVLAVLRGERSALQEGLVVAAMGGISIAYLWGYDAWWLSIVMTIVGAD